MSYRVGDRVKIVRENSGNWKSYIGRVTTISRVDPSADDHYQLKGVPDACGWWNDNELTPVKGDKMGKYYKVIKDTPVWEVGAILVEDDDGENYSALNDLFVKDLKDVDPDYAELSAVVEHAEDFFARVYEVKLLGKAKYLTKVQAREAHEELYKTK